MAVFPEVYAVVTSIPAAAPFSFARAEEPFSFDTQPKTALDQVYRLEAEQLKPEGYCGPYQAERWICRLWLARKTKRAPQAAYDALLVDVTSMTSSLELVHRTSAIDFFVEEDGLQAEIQAPEEAADFLVARIDAIVNFDRAL